MGSKVLTGLSIVEATSADREAIKALFKTVMFDLYQREGILETFEEELYAELREKGAALDEHINSRGAVPYFMVAKLDGQCVGTFALTLPNDLITDNLPLEGMMQLPMAPEVSSVFVLPNMQGKGIGEALLAEAKAAVRRKNLAGFYLDCGYPNSQPYWIKQLGQPSKILENQWGEGLHHMIWQVVL